MKLSRYNLWVVQEKHVEPAWPWPWVYLTKCFKWHIYSWRRTIAQIHVEIHLKFPAKILPSSVTLTLDLPEGMFQMAHLHVMENNCVKLAWNQSTIIEVMVQTYLDGRMHIHRTDIVTIMSNACTNTQGMFQMAHLHVMENNCVKLAWNQSTIIEVMVQTYLDGRTHIHRTVIVTIMSRPPQAGSTKVEIRRHGWQRLLKGGCLDFSHLTELRNIIITEIYMKKEDKSSITKNHKIKKSIFYDGIPLKGYLAS